MKNSFFLVIPEQNNNPELSLSFDEKALTQWLAELPTANPSLSTKLFHDLISAMNSLVLDPQNRLTALETLRPHYLEIEDYLRSRLISSGFPKSANDHKIMNVAISLERQFTLGYWMIVKQLTRRDQGWFKNKNSTLAIQRTIRGLSSIVVTHYMMNANVPDWIWIDLHSLFKLSVELKKETGKVPDKTYALSHACSAEDCYKQILLFSLADPAGLMQKESKQIFHFIEKINHLVKISATATDAFDLQCKILMDEDNAPFFASKTQTSDSATMYLDLSKLYKACQQADKFCSETEPRYSSMDIQDAATCPLSAELFEYLLHRWQGQTVHGSVLFTDRLDRMIAIGLEATFELQNSADNRNTTGLELLAESSSEHALCCEFGQAGMLSIGSLISCRKPKQAQNIRMLGVVSKISLHKEENKLLFELSMISPQSFSVTYHPIDAVDGVEPQKALLYAKKEPNSEKSFIIMDSFLFKEGDILRMYLNQENFPIIIRDRKNIGVGYWQFECRRLTEQMVQNQVPQTNKLTDKKGYDFI